MSKKSKKTIFMSFLLMIIFAAAAQWLAVYQEKTKKKLIHFIQYECLVKSVLDEKGILTQDAIAAVRSELGDWRDGQKKTLWDKFRYSDYWLSVFRTLAVVALLIIFFVVVRSVLSKVYIPKSIYGKIRQTGVDPEMKKEKDG